MNHFGKIVIAATAALGTVAIMHTAPANALPKDWPLDTCGTRTSTAGCVTGNCYDGDMLQANGTWVASAACQGIAIKQGSANKNRAPRETSIAPAAPGTATPPRR